jgi:hypothetical protein
MMLAVAGMALAILPAAAANIATARAGADISATAGLGDIIVAALVVRVPARVTVGAAAVRALALVSVGLPAELRLRRHDDAVIVLGVLEIALGRDQVAGGQSVARERHILLGDMGRGPADLHVGAVRFIAAR